jgi:hypothetical protein
MAGLLFQAIGGQAKQLGHGRQVPVRISEPGVPEVGRQRREQRFDVQTVPVPSDQRRDGQSVTKVVASRPSAIGEAPQARLA